MVDAELEEAGVGVSFKVDLRRRGCTWEQQAARIAWIPEALRKYTSLGPQFLSEILGVLCGCRQTGIPHVRSRQSLACLERPAMDGTTTQQDVRSHGHST